MNASITSPRPSSPADFIARNARFAITLTVAVAAIAWLLASVAKLSEATIVISIMVVSFIASWIGTSTRTAPTRRHRVTVIRVPVRVR